jgi:hypothetical protein
MPADARSRREALRERKAIRALIRLAAAIAFGRRSAAPRRVGPPATPSKVLFTEMNAKADLADQAERISAWQCSGCGRIEGPQPCLGVCLDKKVTFVSSDAYDAVFARMRDAEARLAALESLARRMALAKPRDGEWEKSYRALQDEARRALREAPAPEPARAPQSRESLVEP